MIDYINSILPKIRVFSNNLDNLAKLQNEPWVLIDDIKNRVVKFIFQPNNEVICSKNGVVSIGKWSLLTQANSILLDINNEKRLYNHQFLDNALMVLKLDGASTDFFILANQNLIIDLDIARYIERQYLKPNNYIGHKEYLSISNKKRLGETTLIDGSHASFYALSDSHLSIIEGCEVHINGKIASDGIYKSKSNKRYEIENGILKDEYYIDNFKQNNGLEIEIDGHRMRGITKGSRVWLNNYPAPDGIYKKGMFGKIQVTDGMVEKIL